MNSIKMNAGGSKMRTSIFGIIIMFLLLSVRIEAFEPPRKLTFGMSHGDVANTLGLDGCKVEEPNRKDVHKFLREYSEFDLPIGYSRAKVNKIKLMDKKAEDVYVVYDSLNQLVSFQYILEWVNVPDDNKGFRKCWVFHEDVKKAITQKYGDPSVDETGEDIRGKDMPSGLKYVTRWNDSDGSSISLYITRQTHNAIIAKGDYFYVFLIYSANEFHSNKKMKETDSDQF